MLFVSHHPYTQILGNAFLTYQSQYKLTSDAFFGFGLAVSLLAAFCFMFPLLSLADKQIRFFKRILMFTPLETVQAVEELQQALLPR